uniref:Uncharacterized protein n=1 Tax=Thermorudis peleae TaxID=1382356 RepID=A0A831WZ39_9BACT
MTAERAAALFSHPGVCKIALCTTFTHVNEYETQAAKCEITGRRRDRVFAYDAYLSILNEGAEPF